MSGGQRSDDQQAEPDIALLLALIAFACLATMGELALVVTAPAWVVLMASLLPVVLWALILRQVHRFLRSGEPEDSPSWSKSIRRRLRDDS